MNSTMLHGPVRHPHLPVVTCMGSHLVPPPGVSVKGNKLYDGKGRELKLKGINWFGFNNEQTMVDGLWAG